MAFPVALWIRHVTLPSRLKGRSIGGLLSDLEDAKTGLVQALNEVPAARRALNLRRPPLASPADIAAHLSAINAAYVETLLRMGRGEERPVSFESFAPFAGSRGQEWPTLLDRFEESHARLMEALIGCPVTPRGVHPWFGTLDRSEWAALAAMHYEYHRRQLRWIARSRKKIASR